MSEAYERRIRLIYDALEIRNWKAAIKQATAALAKTKNDHLIRCLKCYALVMSKKTAEAQEMCDDLLKETSTDPDSLRILNLILKELGREKELTAVYISASAARPQDVDLMKLLFGAYVRDFDFVKQQQVALRLQKLDSSNATLYAWWGIVSLILQARAAKSVQSKGMSAQQLLQLAESMAKKRLTATDKQGSYECLMLYLYILKEQAKLKEVLEAIDSEMGKAIQSEDEKALLKAETLFSLEQFEESAAIAGDRWKKMPDDWCSLRLALDSLLPSTAQAALPEVGDALQQCDGKDRWEAAQELVSSFSASSSAADGEFSSTSERAATAALDLETRRRMSTHASASHSGRSEEQALPQLILAAFQIKSHTMSCAIDLRAYVAKLTVAERRWLVERMKDSLPLSEVPQKLELRKVRRIIAAFQIENDAGLPVFGNSEEAVARAAELMTLYRACKHLYENTDEKDRGPADDLPVLAVSALVAAFKLKSSRQPKHLLQAIILLKEVQQSRRVSSSLRLAAASLYSILGAPLQVHKELSFLEIKHIQHDTLSGHFLLPALLAGLCLPEAEKLLAHTSNLFQHHLQDCSVTMMTAYSHGNYTKVVEFVEFKERLEQSFGRAAGIVESWTVKSLKAAQKDSSLAGALQEMKPESEQEVRALENAESGSMRFNQDLLTRPPWFPPSTAGPDLALADWWQQAEASKSTTDCWWSQSRAAESELGAAKEWRAESRRSLCRRNLHCTLFSMVQDREQDVNFQESLRRLLALEGISPSSPDDWMQKLPAMVLPMPLIDLSNSLTAAVFISAQAHQEESHTPFVGYLTALRNSYPLAAERIAMEFEAGRKKSGLLYFGPEWVIASSFLQHLLWSSAWLQGIASQQLSSAPGKRGKEAKSPAKLGNGKGAEDERRSVGNLPAAALQAVSALQKAIVDAAKIIQDACESKAGFKARIAQLQEQMGHNDRLWQDKEVASRCLTDLLKDQEAVLQRLNSLAASVKSLNAQQKEKKR